MFSLITTALCLCIEIGRCCLINAHSPLIGKSHFHLLSGGSGVPRTPTVSECLSASIFLIHHPIHQKNKFKMHNLWKNIYLRVFVHPPTHGPTIVDYPPLLLGASYFGNGEKSMCVYCVYKVYNYTKLIFHFNQYRYWNL